MAFSKKILAIGIWLMVALVVLSFPTSSMSADSDHTYTAQDGSPADSPISDQAMERAALVALYNSADGDHWYHKDFWLTTEPHCSWWGVLCDANGSVINLWGLSGNGLNGPIPPELDNLSNLEALKLGGNELSGSIPSELGNLSNLLVLWLDGNQLSGSIPKELGNLSKLEVFTLYRNQLSGSIPPELGNLSNLRALALDRNQLSGSIPPELGNLSNLRALFLHTNQLSGSIPPELGNLSNLEVLFLGGNQLSGSIPSQLGNLNNLQELSLGDNQLTGSIPPELGNLGNMSVLSLGRNQLSGSIPPELGNLSNLRGLSLSFNQLSGPIPSELGNLSNLRGLHLSFNQLSGPIPPELGNLSELDYRLDLNDNQLSGPIPKELGNLTNLQEMLDLSHNQLSGPIPPELSNLSSLESLKLDLDTGLCVSTLELLEFLDSLRDYDGPRTLCDTTPPTLSLPPDTVLEATSSAGAVHHFTVTATDDMDPSPVVECNPPSGSTFPLGTTWVTCTATDASGNSSSGDFTVTVKPVTVDIDIKPGGDPNCFNSDGHGVIPVAILSNADFDAAQVDPATVLLDGQEVRVVGKQGNIQAYIEDVSGDGLDDLMLQFEDRDGNYDIGDTVAVLTGATFDGLPIEGEDTICIKP